MRNSELPKYLGGNGKSSSVFRKRTSVVSGQRSSMITYWVAFTILCTLSTGLYLIVSHSWHSILGVPLLAEGMILSVYLRHECAHLLAFDKRRNNIIFGEILSSLTGDLQSPFVEYRRSHLRHHWEQIDLIGMELSGILGSSSGSHRAFILVCEALYIPVVFLIVRIDTTYSALRTNGRRLRTLISLGIYGLIYYMLFRASYTAPLLLLAATVVRIHIIRFVDAFQHNYDRVSGEERSRPRGWAYEQCNTYSFLVSKRHRVWNLLLLNFGFHNAHHAVPNCPWYHLPKIDRELQHEWRNSNALDSIRLLHEETSIWFLLGSFHRNRVNRILNFATSEEADSKEGFSITTFLGVFTDNLLG